MPLFLTRLVHRLSGTQAAVLLALALLAIVIGALLFSLADHVSFGIGLYWAFTTATTVGYGDVTRCHRVNSSEPTAGGTPARGSLTGSGLTADRPRRSAVLRPLLRCPVNRASEPPPVPSEDGPGTNGAVAPTEPQLASPGQSRRSWLFGSPP